MTSPQRTLRVAAAQLAVTSDTDANLATVLRMIDAAAEHAPDVIVLPEFCNHIAWYDNAEHCYDVAVTLDGRFLTDIAARAAQHRCLIKLNVTLRRDPLTRTVTGTNLIYGRDGALLGIGDKQVLMGNENNFLTPATELTEIVRTDNAAYGMYCCMDGVIPEVARGLALRGATVLLNSLNSFAYDEAALHIPVRAAENRVFVVAANKIGPLVPPAMLDAIASRMQISPHFLHGAGESQIVAPDGTVLAIAPRTGEAVVWADIDPHTALDKQRPDGTDVFGARRPALYAPLAEPPKPREKQPGAERVTVGVWSGHDVTQLRIDAPAPALICLPDSPVDLAGLQTKLHGTDTLIAAMRDDATVVLIGAHGVLLEQRALHDPIAGDTALRSLDLPWGRVAVLHWRDAIFPETFRLAALQDIEVIAMPYRPGEAWEMQLGLPERAAENRLAILAAARDSACSAVYAADPDFTLWTAWKNRPFDGRISTPIVTRATQPGLTLAEVFPAAAANRMVSQKTDLLTSRPWRLIV
jgi:deaminated glutathione amidase